LRILAECSQDPAFLDAYRKGEDLHSRTAAEMFNVPIEKVTRDQRTVAKTINFGLCYGMSAKGLSESCNITLDKAESFINQYFMASPQVKNTLQTLGMRAIQNRFSVTLGGRKRYFHAPDSFSSSKSLERKGRNTPIQGTCADILKKAILYLSESLKEYDASIVNLVHDEIVIEVRENQAQAVSDIVKREMIRAGRDYIKSVPVEVDVNVATTWRK
jgi:DNA polymerase-1